MLNGRLHQRSREIKNLTLQIAKSILSTDTSDVWSWSNISLFLRFATEIIQHVSSVFSILI